MRRFCLLLWAIMSLCAADAQIISTEKLDAYFDTLARNDKFMGSVSVFRDGEQVYAKSVGSLDAKLNNALNDQTMFCVGSISKTFTSVLIFMAVEQDLLSLDQTLDRFFPKIPNADKITIAHLLKHSSGISNYVTGDFSQWSNQPKSSAQMVEIIRKAGVDFEPGAKISYSNSGYVLLSCLLEQLYNCSFAAILDNQIIKPLGLTNTDFDLSGRSGDQLSGSCIYKDKWSEATTTNPLTLMGAGGIWSTPKDINIFAHALFSGDLVGPQSLAAMTKVQDNVGMGLFRMPFYDNWGYGHTGGIDGFRAFFIYLPEQKIAYSATSNALNYTMNDISIAVLNAVFGKPFDIPEFVAVELKSEDLDRYLGVYSCAQLPIKLTVTKKGDKLIAQGTGQPHFELEANGADKFSFVQAGVKLEFDPQEGIMVFRQGGGVFVMTRQ